MPGFYFHILKNQLILIIFLGILFLPKNLPAQAFNPGMMLVQQPLLMDSLDHQLNFYNLAHNPAALFEDEQKRSLEIRQNTIHSSGDFRLPFSAQATTDQHYLVKNVQPLSSNDLFKGYFAYHRKTDKNVMWIDQEMNTNNNPFIFADSSTGDFILNGLYWSAEWAHRFNRSWLSGISFFYNVGQRLKQVFPKPLNKHRDIHFRYGLQYQTANWKAGLSYAYLDEQEKVEITKYNLSQGLTPQIYKFRFSDLPVIIRSKTSEERMISRTGYELNGQLKRVFPGGSVTAQYSYWNKRGKIIDGGSKNIKQGTFDQTDRRAAVFFNYRFKLVETLFSYHFKQLHFRAYHPDFSFLIWKAPSDLHQFNAGFLFKYWPSLPLFFDAGYGFYTDNRVDLMSVNYWRFQRKQQTLRSGFIRHTARFDFTFWFAYTGYQFMNMEKSDNSYSHYYSLLFEGPYNFFTKIQSEKTVALQSIYHYGPMMDLELSLVFHRYESPAKARDNLFFSLRAKLFIF